MFDKLLDLILDFFGLFQFWVVIDEYERGVVKTLGKRRPKKHWHQFWMRSDVVLGPGLHFVWPLGIDEVLCDNVVPCVDEFDEQSLTTKDGKSITLNVVVMWSIADVEKIFFEVEDSDSALEESVCGTVGELVSGRTWASCKSEDFAKAVKRRVSARVRKWGISIHSVQIKNLTLSRAIRLL